MAELYRGNSLTMGSNRNITASYAFILFGACIYLIMTMRGMIRMVYIPAAIVHLLVIFLSNSRTSFLATIFMMTCIAFKLVKKHLKKRITIIVGVLFLILAGIALLYLLRYGALESNAEMWKEKLNDADAMSLRKMDGLGGRVTIWKAAFTIMFSSVDRFFLGVTPIRVSSALSEVGTLVHRLPHCHNLFLNIGVSFGVPAMSLYIWFAGSVVRKGIRIMKYEGDKLPANFWMISVIVLGILLIEMMEVLTFANRFFNEPIFFILAGWIVETDRFLKKDEAAA